MIIIAGGSVPVDLYGMTPLEREIAEQKIRSGTPFHYESMESLRFELKLREAIVDSSVAMQRSGAVFRSFKKNHFAMKRIGFVPRTEHFSKDRL